LRPGNCPASGWASVGAAVAAIINSDNAAVASPNAFRMIVRMIQLLDHHLCTTGNGGRSSPWLSFSPSSSFLSL
jgi:hypothetical protein